MPKKLTGKILASVSFVLMIALQIFGYGGFLIPFSTEEIAIRFPTLLFPSTGVQVSLVVLSFSILLYLLFSYNRLGKPKNDVVVQFTYIADVGLCLVASLQCVDIYLWHAGLFGVCIVLRILLIFLLLRICAAYEGSHLKLFWPVMPFKLYLGWAEYLTVLALGTAISAWSVTGLFTLSARAVLLLLLLTMLSMIIGLIFLDVSSMLVVLFCEGSIAAMHLSRTSSYAGRFPEIYISAILCMAALVAAVIAALIKQKRGK